MSTGHLIFSLLIWLLFILSATSMQEGGHAPFRVPVFCEAIKVRDLSKVRCLVRTKPEIMHECFLSRTPLAWAAGCGFFEIAEFLVLNGANVSTPDYWKRTPLHMAVIGGFFDIMQLLILAGARINEQDSKKKAPLHYAVEASDLCLIRLLVVAGADVNARDEREHTPLFRALTYDVADFLIEAGARTRVFNDEQICTLYYAAQKGRDGVVRRLVEAGDDTWCMGSWNRTALHTAAAREHIAVLQCLLRSGAEVDPKDHNYNTPLHLAAFFCNAEVARRLMMAGADVEARDRARRTPFHLALTLRHRNVVEAFIRFGVDVSLAFDREVSGVLACDNWRAVRRVYIKMVIGVLESDEVRASTDLSRDINMLILYFVFGDGNLFIFHSSFDSS